MNLNPAFGTTDFTDDTDKNALTQSPLFSLLVKMAFVFPLTLSVRSVLSVVVNCAYY
jgi:hypothetical protein